MNQEMDWEEYEKILMQRPGFKETLEETLLEYETARTKIKSCIMILKVDSKNRKLADISFGLARGSDVNKNKIKKWQTKDCANLLI